MSIVTQIKPQRNKKRVNIYLDGKYSFGLDLEAFVKLGLKVEQELTEAQIAEIVKRSEYKGALDKLINFAMLRPRSKKEILDWLKKKKVHESVHEKLLKSLNKLELVGDARFAKWWIGQRQEFKQKSKRELIFELKKKGVSNDDIDDALFHLEVDDFANAVKVLSKTSQKWDRFGRKEKRQKMYQYLARKGFNYAVISKAVDHFLEKR